MASAYSSLLNSKIYPIAQIMGNILEFTASIPGINKLVRYAGVPTSDQSTDDEKATANLLKSMGRDFETNELILTTLSNEPGALANMATKLSDAKINIISFYIMKMELDVADVALTTDNPEKTKEILGI